MAKTAECATFKVRIKVVPCEGFEMVRVTGGEFLFLKADDPTRNVLVDAHTMASVFEELASGGLYDEFGHGYGTFWRIVEVVEA